MGQNLVYLLLLVVNLDGQLEIWNQPTLWTDLRGISRNEITERKGLFP